MKFNVNEIDIIKNAIQNYKVKLEESKYKLSHQIEFADNFNDSAIFDLFKGYLEGMIQEIDKINNHVDSLNQSLIDSEKVGD